MLDVSKLLFLIKNNLRLLFLKYLITFNVLEVEYLIEIIFIATYILTINIEPVPKFKIM